MPEQQPTALSIRGLSKSFGGLRAVDDISIEVEPRTIHGVLGPNGAGKTTLLNLISGFVSPDAGEITVATGARIDGASPHEIARQGLARTYQNVRLFSGMTVLETVMAGFYMRRKARFHHTLLFTKGERRERQESEERARDLLGRTGVTGRHNVLSEELSYGEQRRVEIARAMATDPKLLLLDEPTAGMNSTESGALGDLMRELVDEGVTLILIEHNIELVVSYCDRASVMNFGKLLAEGGPRECLTDPAVREAYFGSKRDAERVESLLQLRGD